MSKQANAGVPKVSVEDYLRSNAVRDPEANLDGEWVPLSVAHLAAELLSQSKLELRQPTHYSGVWPRKLNPPKQPTNA